MNLQISNKYNLFKYIKEKFLAKISLLDFNLELLEE